MQAGNQATAQRRYSLVPGHWDFIHPEPARGRREDGDHGAPGAHWGGGAKIGRGQAAAGHHREAAKPGPQDENPIAGAAEHHAGTMIYNERC